MVAKEKEIIIPTVGGLASKLANSVYVQYVGSGTMYNYSNDGIMYNTWAWNQTYYWVDFHSFSRIYSQILI